MFRSCVSLRNRTDFGLGADYWDETPPPLGAYRRRNFDEVVLSCLGIGWRTCTFGRKISVRGSSCI